MRTVVGGKLEAILHRSEVENAAAYDFVAVGDTVGKLLVVSGGCIVLVNRISGIYSPVDIEFHEQGLSHPAGRLAIGVGADLGGKYRDNLKEL